jgi:NAD(P)-dependent dehydrogenase (short-subunit alcohol dehydrogenase family)
MKIAVVDGQGGGIGKSLVEKLRASLGDSVCIIALGTNALATAAMLKAGADMGATGENAVVVNAATADMIVGSIGIIAANSMLGEMTPRMAEAIASSEAQKVLIPLNRCNLHVAGTQNRVFQDYIDDAIAIIRSF